jgi:N-methylhydantoinase A/oxoprolinase/acetone carboxylase beta subunit
MRVGVDTGGTFTDVVFADGSIRKVPSTPDDPARAVRDGVAGGVAGGGEVDLVAHGTTVATNALLEGRLAPVSLVTNEGLEDVVEIGRQNRPSLYDHWADRPPALVPRGRRYGVAGRLAADGSELVPLGAVPVVDTDAVAVCLLHSDLDARHEQAVARELVARGLDVTCSHEVSPEFREYERTVTTVVNAGLRPLCRAYLEGLRDIAPSVRVMSSAGGLLDVGLAAEQPARLLVSGPAGGVRAAAAVAAANGFAGAVSFDMGGTSTDVCLVLGALPDPAPSVEVGGYPVRLPSLGIHTIGAGGGSVAVLDAGGALLVGPESAGARPGPACYGHGGTRPTVTDADLVLGRIPHGTAFPGLGPLDLEAARRALDAAGVAATDVVTVVDANMTEAVRAVTVSRGVDPRTLALVAFGGAGPLHACAIAEALDMPAVIVPARAGVFSAVGLLTAPEQVDLVHTIAAGADPSAAVAALLDRARQLLPGCDTEVAFDCRYAGQSHELRVETPDAFHAEHERRNGYARPHHRVDVVAARVSARRHSAVDMAALPAMDRSPVTGPAVVAEADCTIWVAPGWVGGPGAAGALVLVRAS